MSHQDSGWRPKGATETYNGYEVWDHGVHPHEINCGDTELCHDHEDDQG